MTTIPLQYPIEVEGHEVITEITLRRLKAKDLKRLPADEDGVDQGMSMIAVISDLPVEVIEEMDADDFTHILEVAADFLPGKASIEDKSSSGERS